MFDSGRIKALTFDLRHGGGLAESIIREGKALARAKGLDVDWAKFADAWRGLYQPAMDRVRRGEVEWTKLDDLHRMSLVQLLRDFRITGLTEAEVDDFNRAWHRLDPWPDAVPGLTRLKKKYVLTTLSNGNVALMVNMAKRGGLPWDVILGAEATRHYKPQPEAYIGTAAPGPRARKSAAGRRAQRRSEAAAAPGSRRRSFRVPRARAGPDGDLKPEASGTWSPPTSSTSPASSAADPPGLAWRPLRIREGRATMKPILQLPVVQRKLWSIFVRLPTAHESERMHGTAGDP